MTREMRTSRARWAEDHDGDTTRLYVDQLFDITGRHWMRLRRVFAPELDQKGGPEVAAFVHAWMAVLPAAPWPLEVDTWRTSGDEDVRTLSRYVAEVRRVDTGTSLNDAVVAYVAAHPEWPRGTGAKETS